MKIIASETKNEAIDAVRPHPRNPREGDVGAIHQSIEVNGFYGSIIAQKSTGHILAGNHRWQAAMQQGATEIPVTWIDVDNDHALRILLADNRTNDVASYNDDELANILEQLVQDTGTLAGTGYDGDALDDLLEDLGRESTVEPEEAPEAQVDRADELREKWGTEVGQLWQIGEHRLLCGDSYDSAIRHLVLNGKTPNAVITDPPYGIAYEESKNWAKPDKKKRPIKGDDRPFDFTPFYDDNVKIYAVWGANYFSDTIPNYREGNYVVWAKAHSDDENAVFGSAFEIVWMYPKRKQMVWFVRRINMTGEENGLHVTQKPLEVMQRCLDYHKIKENARIFDPFSGSGTTLVAAHTRNAIGHGIEIDPAYVAVILQRFADMGLQPELVND